MQERAVNHIVFCFNRRKNADQGVRRICFPPMKHLLCSLILLTAALRADEAQLPAEAQRVVKEYEAAVEAAKKRLVPQLQAAMQNATTRGQLDAALKVKEALMQLEQGGANRGVEGSRWTFPVKNMPREKQWIEFRAGGVLQPGWTPNQKSWNALSADRVSFRPYTDESYVFVIEIDPNFTRAKITEGEFKGETIQRLK